MKKLLLLILFSFLIASCSVLEWTNRPDDVHEAIENQPFIYKN